MLKAHSQQERRAQEHTPLQRTKQPYHSDLVFRFTMWIMVTDHSNS